MIRCNISENGPVGGEPDPAAFLKEWLVKGYHGSIDWAERPEEADLSILLSLETGASPHGYAIKSDGKTAKITSGSQRGLLYGVYGLLEKLFGFTPYAADEIAFHPYEWQSLPVFEAEEEPSFPWRMYLCSQPDREKTRDLLRVQDSIWAGPHGNWFHTTLQYLPFEKYGEEHPDWYSKFPGKGIPRQLCFSTLAEGGEAYEIFLEAAKQVILENPDKPNLSVTQEDAPSWCDCPKCRALSERYGADAAPLVLFLNRLSDDIKAWREEQGMNSELTIVSFAAYHSLAAPVKKQGDTYVPTDPAMVLRDNVGIMYAPIQMDYGKPFTHPDNFYYAENLRRWRVLCKKLYIWTYQTNFSHYLVPYDWFPTAQENFKFCRDHNVWCYYDQGQFNQTNPTAFNAVKTFLTAKLLWKADDDQEKLTKEFFEAYYGPGAAFTRKYFDEVLENNARWYREIGIGNEWYIYFMILRKEIWPEEALRRWNGYLIEAGKAIEESPLPEERKQTLLRRVEIERLAPRYLLCTLYDTELEGRKALLNDLETYQVGLLSEGKQISALQKEWLDV